MLTILFTSVGTGLSVMGIVCAAVAFHSTWTEHGDELLLPRFSVWLEKWQGHLRRTFRRRSPRVVSVSSTADLGVFTASARLTVTGPVIPPDTTLDEQVALLIRRVQNIEREALDDRNHNNAEATKIREDIAAVSTQLDQSTSEVREKTQSMVLGTIRLQLLGLLLVGAGTICLAIPVFAGA